MPREQINYPGDYDAKSIPEGEFRDRTLHVVWYPNPLTDKTEVYVELSGDPDDFASPYVDGVSERGFFSEPLAREEINKMIRALRRARDKAFGPDA